MTGREQAVVSSISDDVVVAMWCCSVGATWTIELHRLDCGPALGTLVDWISSGVPISQPEPEEELARELLAERGLYLFRNLCARPSTYSRHSIGYVCSNAKQINLADSTG
ncbi:MAG: hypothetical protein ACT4NY_34410 [Pseudonocardiales bacterium]